MQVMNNKCWLWIVYWRPRSVFCSQNCCCWTWCTHNSESVKWFWCVLQGHLHGNISHEIFSSIEICKNIFPCMDGILVNCAYGQFPCAWNFFWDLFFFGTLPSIIWLICQTKSRGWWSFVNCCKRRLGPRCMQEEFEE